MTAREPITGPAPIEAEPAGSEGESAGDGPVRAAGDHASAMTHHACVYGSDEEFLETAVPFITDGLARKEPVLVTTTSANLELLREVLGRDAERIDHAESAYFGRRPAHRLNAFYRYWRRQAGESGHVRILTESVWFGRSHHEVRAWTCTEAALNVTLAGTNLWLMCPYDTRHLDPSIIADVLRTHPAWAERRAVHESTDYADPALFVRERQARPLSSPPDRAARRSFAETNDVRCFVAAQAAGSGLIGNRAAALVVAAGDVAAYLLREGTGTVAVSMWNAEGSIWCDFHEPAGAIPDPAFLGLTPPPGDLRDDDGIWQARQLCDWVEIRTTDSGIRVRLQFPGPRTEELLNLTLP